MGRGSRTSTPTISSASLRGGDDTTGLSGWQDRPLPGRGDLRQADWDAPRDAHASSEAARHPDWNEDRALCDQQAAVAVLLDGMGGMAGGERAAENANGAFALQLPHLPGRCDVEGRRRWLYDSLALAAAVNTEDRLLHVHLANMQTTVVAACLADTPTGATMLLEASAGDSRAYRFPASGGVEQLTSDDDLIANKQRLGVYTAQQAGDARELLDSVVDPDAREDATVDLLFKQRNSVTASLDENEGFSVRPHPVKAGDLIVLCSDGVHDNLARAEIEQIVAERRAHGPQAVSEALRAAARARADDSAHVRAKDDDITVVCLAV